VKSNCRICNNSLGPKNLCKKQTLLISHAGIGIPGPEGLAIILKAKGELSADGSRHLLIWLIYCISRRLVGRVCPAAVTGQQRVTSTLMIHWQLLLFLALAPQLLLRTSASWSCRGYGHSIAAAEIPANSSWPTLAGNLFVCVLGLYGLRTH